VPRRDTEHRFVFGGFESPHYTQVPDDFFDLLLSELTPAEFKVCAYIIRRTFGWKKDADAISLSQMVNGIRRRDGTHVDGGTGLTKPTVIAAIKGLLEKGVIVRQLNSSPERGNEASTYALRLAGDPLDPAASALPPPVKEVDRGESPPPSNGLTTPGKEVDRGEHLPLSGDLTGRVKALDPHHDSSQQRTGQQAVGQHRAEQQTTAQATAQAGDPSRDGARPETVAAHGGTELLGWADGRGSTASMTTRQAWQMALAELQGTMTPATFETWVKNTVALEGRDGGFVIAAPNTFAQEWLATRFRKQIEAALGRVLGRPVALRVTVEGREPAPSARRRWKPGAGRRP
jgi:hypothetical protein